MRTKRKAAFILQICFKIFNLDSKYAGYCLLEDHTSNFKTTQSWIKCQKILDEPRHSVHLDKKEEIQ